MQLGIGVGAAAVGVALCGWRVPRPALIAGAALAVVALMAGSTLIPVGAALRSAVQPGLAGHVDAGLALANTGTHPLAIAPHAALSALAFAVQVGVLGVGVAAGVRSEGDARFIAWSIVGAGTFTAFAAAGHAGLGLDTIWGGTVPASKAGFFAPFVNPNHAAFLMAAALATAVGLAGRGGTERLVAGAAIAVLATGVVFAGSRSGPVVALVAAGAVPILVGTTRLRLAAVAGLGTAVVGIAIAGTRYVALVDPATTSNAGLGRRLARLADGLSLVAASPIVGVGPGGFAEAHPVVKSTPWYGLSAHLHNDALQAIVELGVPAGALLIATIVGIVAFAARRVATAGTWTGAGLVGACVAILLGSAWDFPLHIGALALVFAVAAGAVTGLVSPRGTGRSARVRAGAAVAFVAAAAGWAVATLSPNDSLWAAPGTELRQLARSASPDLARHRLAREARKTPVASLPRLALAEVELRDGHPGRALALAEAATAVHPTNAGAWLAVARLRRLANDVDGSVVAWIEVLSLDLPPHQRVDPLLVEALRATPTAAALLGPLVARRPDRACAAADLMTLDDAVPWFEATSDTPSCRVTHARSLTRAGEPERALNELAPLPEGCGRARVAARASLDLERFDDALAWHQRALDLCGSDHAAIRTGLLVARGALGDVRAAELVEAEITTHPSDLQLRRDAARMYDDPRAVPHLEVIVLAGRATSAEADRYLALSTWRDRPAVARRDRP